MDLRKLKTLIELVESSGIWRAISAMMRSTCQTNMPEFQA